MHIKIMHEKTSYPHIQLKQIRLMFLSFSHFLYCLETYLAQQLNAPTGTENKFFIHIFENKGYHRYQLISSN